MDNEVVVTNLNFEAEVLKSEIPVIADFWAEWCGPCKMIAPALRDLAEQYKGLIKIAKIDVDVESELSMQFNVVSIPTVMIFSKGQIVRSTIGALPKAAYEKMVKEVLA